MTPASEAGAGGPTAKPLAYSPREQKLLERLTNAEARASFLSDLDRAVQPLTEPDDVMSVTARMLAEHLRADRCAYAEVEDESIFVITGDFTRDVPSIVGSWPVAAFGRECERQMLANEAFLVTDTDVDERIAPEDLAAYRATTIRAAICVPLHKQGKLTAAMAVHQKVPRVWTAAEIDLVQTSVNRCWESLERTRAARVVGDSEETYRLLAETASDAIIQIDVNNTVQFVNSAATRIFGYGADELIGQSLTMIMPPEMREGHRLGMARYLETGKRNVNWASVEVPAMHKDGHRFPLEISFGESGRDDKRFFIGIARDITERRRTEDALRESEHRLRTMADSIPQLAWMAEADGYIFWYNQKWYEYTGTTPQQMEGWGWQSVHDPEILPRVLDEWKGAIRMGTPFGMEFPIRSADGAFRWFLTRVNPLRNSEGEIVRWFGTNTDIEERREAEETILNQKLLLESLIESVLDGILIVSPSGKMLHHNQRFLDIWNFPAEVIESRSDKAALAWAAKQTTDPEAFLARVNDIYGHPDVQFREEMSMNNGKVYERFGASVQQGDTRLGWVWTFRDITERKHMEEALERHGEELEATVRLRTRELRETNKGLKSENQKRRRLEAERLKLLAVITTVQEDERRRMARDLHDHFGQQLTALRFRIGFLGMRGYADDEFEPLIAETQALVEQIDQDVDSLSWDLRPPSLDDIGLAASLADYINEWSRRFEIPVRFRNSRFGKKRLLPESETHLYRITQEILTNICKHAKATSVDISLEKSQGSAILTVVDDGVGFLPKKHKPAGGSGMGLIGMRERAAIMGGILSVESEPGKGTIVIVNVPEQGPQNKK